MDLRSTEESMPTIQRLRSWVRIAMTGVCLAMLGAGLLLLDGAELVRWSLLTLCVWAFYMGLHQASLVLSQHLEQMERRAVRVRPRRRR